MCLKWWGFKKRDVAAVGVWTRAEETTVGDGEEDDTLGSDANVVGEAAGADNDSVDLTKGSKAGDNAVEVEREEERKETSAEVGERKLDKVNESGSKEGTKPKDWTGA